MIARIDPHVHCRDEEQSYKETIAHVMRIADAQGVYAVFDMPNTFRAILYRADVQRRLDVASGFLDRYFLYVGASSNEKQLEEAMSCVNDFPNVVGIKLFAGKSVGDLAVVNKDDQRVVYRTLSSLDYRGVLPVHCEKESLMSDCFDPNDPYTHCLSRPKIAEIESIRDQIEFATESGFKGTLHICHISCPESVDLVDAARARKQIEITCGVTPHHIMWSDKMLRRPDGLMYKMNPPLRPTADVAKMREYLLQGKIDWIETDHAPHAVIEKMSKPYLSGYPSLSWYKYFVESFLPEFELGKEQIRGLTRDNILRAFSLQIPQNLIG